MEIYVPLASLSVYTEWYIFYEMSFFNSSSEYSFFPRGLGSFSLGMIIVPVPTFNFYCFYSLLLPSSSPFWLIGLMSSLSCSYESLKCLGLMYFLMWHKSLFGFHAYYAPRETHLYTRQDSDMSNHNQNILEVSLPFLSALHPPLFWSHLLHLSYSCNSLLASQSISSTPYSNHNIYHYQVILPKTLVSFY